MQITEAVARSRDVIPKRSNVDTDKPEFWSFEAAAARFRELIGKRKPPRIPKAAQRKEKLTAVFSDLHIPHHDEDFLWESIAKAKSLGCTRAVVPGDFGDQFGFSRFEKYEFEPIEKELAEGALVAQMLAESFEEVEIIPGNHDMRAKKFFAKAVPSEFFFLVRWNLLEIMCADLPNVKLPVMTIDGRPLPFLWNDGDLVLGHPETSSKIPLRAVGNFADWLNTWKKILCLDHVRVIGQGHTHQAGGPVMRADGLAVFELGCMCRLPDYCFDSKLRYRPQTNAWTLFVQRNGVIDLNESRMFFKESRKTPCPALIQRT